MIYRLFLLTTTKTNLRKHDWMTLTCMRAVNAVDRGWRGVDEADDDTARDSPWGKVQAEAGPHQLAVRGVLLVDMAETHCEAPS